jgi:hypothetical protein
MIVQHRSTWRSGVGPPWYGGPRHVHMGILEKKVVREAFDQRERPRPNGSHEPLVGF